ncbi:hypothetical protein MPL3356_350057 [Mesorhizobium plurifarium]|uniref:Uncharacterized protein n=1 Tax=Mesorhizobium plurifarium TaxID=69974 RepID=A0A090DWF9_MESPL|nr:hypothetical protein MPL3356_350057 [Mesorhizobium plurifarium]
MRVPNKEFIGPDDMAMLERVLKKLLPADADTAEREWLGTLLIAAFKAGVTSEAELAAKVDKTKRR